MLAKYFYIQSEIDRLKFEEDESNFQADRKRHVAEIMKQNRIKLENALREQKKEDEKEKNKDKCVGGAG